jgi:hypothetical protein
MLPQNLLVSKANPQAPTTNNQPLQPPQQSGFQQMSVTVVPGFPPLALDTSQIAPITDRVVLKR